MVKQLTLRKVGGSLSITLPSDMAQLMKLESGDTVFATATQDSIVLSPYDDKVQEQIETGRKFMKKYRSTFRKLANA